MLTRGLPYDAEDHSAIKGAALPLSVPPPPAAVAPAPPASSDLEAALLEAFDWGRPLPPGPKLSGTAAREDRWLRAAATFDPARDLPADPFPAGAPRQEAEALRRLLRTSGDRLARALATQPLRHTGTALALWRWGRLQVRSGAFPPSLRRAWEDCLLSGGPGLTRGYALRHALCWALADQDEARFAALRPKAQGQADDTLRGFQRLFGVLGGPSPELRLWRLPGLEYRDLRLDQLGARRVWICPVQEGPLPDLPAKVAWIIPSLAGGLGERDASLAGEALIEGHDLAERLRTAGRAAQFAPSRVAFERLGLAWFPALIELDASGRVQAIRMGDAAPERP